MAVMRLILPAVLFLSACCCLRAETESEIQTRIDAAIKAGGGEVLIAPGTITIRRGLILKDAKGVRLMAAKREKTVLQLGPLAFAEVVVAAAPGDASLTVKHAQNLSPGMRLKIEADGEPDSFTKRPKPYQIAILAAAGGSRLVLKEPLRFPVPAGTFIRHEDAPNLIEIRGRSEGIRIENLTLDGGRAAKDPPVRGHVQLCGVFAAGPYSYENGPSGARLKGITISGCTIRNCFGRGVAFYSVEESLIEDCTISDTNDEAIDLAHFTVQTIARRNRAERCNTGVELNDASDCRVEQNEFRRCRTGLNLWRWCKQPGLNERNRISDNLFSDSEGNAVQIMKGTARNIVTGNVIANAGRNGISLSGAGQIVTGNRITGAKLKPIAISEGEHTLRDNE